MDFFSQRKIETSWKKRRRGWGMRKKIEERWEIRSGVTEILWLFQVYPPGQGQPWLSIWSDGCLSILSPHLRSQLLIKQDQKLLLVGHFQFCMAFELKYIFIFLKTCSKTEGPQSLRYLLWGSCKKVCDILLKVQTQVPAGFPLIFLLTLATWYCGTF